MLRNEIQKANAYKYGKRNMASNQTNLKRKQNHNQSA